MFDAIVVGGGPAGLAAGLTLGRALRSTLIIDSGEPRNAPASEMHNFISRDGTPPFELRRMARRELERYSTVEVRDTLVMSTTSLGDDTFEITLADGTRERARRLLLATGLVDELPAIEGMAELWGRGVFHCPYCHGYEIRDMALAVLGAKPSAVQLALHVTRFSGDVVLCTNGSDELDAEASELLATNGVMVREEPIARLEGEKGRLRAIRFVSGETLERQGAFFPPAERQRCDLALTLGCRLTPKGVIHTGAYEKTGVPGLYVAGDATRLVHLAIVAAAEGAMAAYAVNTELTKEDVA
jgi:thioredoxin reductase